VSENHTDAEHPWGKPICRTCGDTGWISGWTTRAKACPDCAVPYAKHAELVERVRRLAIRVEDLEQRASAG